MSTSTRTGRAARPAVLAAAMLAWAACGGGSERAAWIHLAWGYRPSAVESGAELPRGVTQPGRWVESEFPGKAWKPVPGFDDVWVAPPPLRTDVRGMWPRGARLRDGTTEFRRVSVARARRDMPRGSFAVMNRKAFFRPPEDLEWPSDLRYALWIELGREVDGVWRTPISGCTGEGIPLWPGDRERVRAAVPRDSNRAGSTLRFFLVMRAFPERRASLTLRIRAGDEVVFERSETPRMRPEGAWHEVPLPVAGEVELVFELEGDGGQAAVLAPVVGPASPPGPAQRSGRSQPDVVLVVADTFRADNMAAYGGDGTTTPHLDRLAERSALFADAWAPAPATLPSQVAMMTSYYQPRQRFGSSGMADDLTTLAEHLAARGYRTGAVTDSIYISRTFGFDQGFEWFQENAVWDLEKTFQQADAFLAADDGRPVFLFLHTYRTHAPYREGPSEDSTTFFEAIEGESLDSTKLTHLIATSERSEHILSELLRQYRAGARVLDARLGPWIEGLERQGYLERGFLVFTSDHGEGFYEHDEMSHGGTPWNEKIRIPLFFLGGEIEPGAIGRPASLVDLPVTISELAGIPPSPEWAGVSLLRPGPEAPIFSFAKNHIAFVDGRRKLIAEREGNEAAALTGAFDLASDPGETRDLREEPGAVPGELLATMQELLEAMQEGSGSSGEVELSPAERKRLRDLGYAGD